MAWKPKKFKVAKIGKTSFEKPLEIQNRAFDTYEEAESDLLSISPMQMEHYTILPIYTFEPEQ